METNLTMGSRLLDFSINLQWLLSAVSAMQYMRNENVLNQRLKEVRWYESHGVCFADWVDGPIQHIGIIMDESAVLMNVKNKDIIFANLMMKDVTFAEKYGCKTNPQTGLDDS